MTASIESGSRVRVSTVVQNFLPPGNKIDGGNEGK